MICLICKQVNSMLKKPNVKCRYLTNHKTLQQAHGFPVRPSVIWWHSLRMAVLVNAAGNYLYAAGVEYSSKCMSDNILVGSLL